MQLFTEPKGCPKSKDRKHDWGGPGRFMFKSVYQEKHYLRLIKNNALMKAQEYAEECATGWSATCKHCGTDAMHETLMEGM